MGRDDKKSKNSDEFDFFPNGSYWINSLISPTIYLVTAIVYLHPEHDRAWMLQFQNEHAGLSASYYGQVYGNAIAMWSLFITTLRDKKLIGKDFESILTFAVAGQIP